MDVPGATSSLGRSPRRETEDEELRDQKRGRAGCEDGDKIHEEGMEEMEDVEKREESAREKRGVVNLEEEGMEEMEDGEKRGERALQKRGCVNREEEGMEEMEDREKREDQEEVSPHLTPQIASHHPVLASTFLTTPGLPQPPFYKLSSLYTRQI